jgi:hypothetical protein
MTKRNGNRTRDDLIELVRYGNLKPGEAEAEAAANGWPPLAFEPPLPAFDPIQVTRWSIVMAIAWIAWRDIDVVRRQQSDFRAECTHWLFRHWQEPSATGARFKKRSGWFLESWNDTSTARLALLQAIRTADDNSPTMQMPVREAEASLWRALSDGLVVAIALDPRGKPLDIPQRDWAYLKLFEERNHDALKYNALDPEQPFTETKIPRDDILKLWPRVAPYLAADERTIWPIEPYMLKLISDPGNSGYIPLCAAIQWIMTDSGKRSVTMDDPLWLASVRKLWPAICTGEIELIGLQTSQTMTARIPGHSLALINVLPPLHDRIGEILLTAPSHVACTPYVDADHWLRDFNDQIYETGQASPTWTHLQVRKSHLLDRWPKSPSLSNVEQDCYRLLIQQMQNSPSTRPRPRAEIWADAKGQLPALAKRQFDRAWMRAISDSGAKGWSKAGRPAAKSNHRGR